IAARPSALHPHSFPTRRSSDLVESLVVATGSPPEGSLQFEHAAILAVCTTPVSVAEVAARVSVPLGVAQILVGYLADAGLVRVRSEEHTSELQSREILVCRLLL